jgi:hypothetical protein
MTFLAGVKTITSTYHGYRHPDQTNPINMLPEICCTYLEQSDDNPDAMTCLALLLWLHSCKTQHQCKDCPSVSYVATVASTVVL